MHLPIVVSDHFPLLVTSSLAVGSGPCNSRFLEVWRSHGEFINVIRKAWEAECEGRPVRVLLSKLKAVKNALRLWNNEVFGNVFDHVQEREERVLSLERSLENNPTEEGEHLLTQAQCDFKAALLQVTRYWHQKACVRWLKEGDANTRFFYAQFKQCCVRSYIYRIKDMNGIWVDEQSQIESMAIEYFSEVLAQQA
ncbi:uncharacterized protein [Coffea arabica]|uniref:Endonuclease/exonuclease/phosphatase domain-containing protein n=1 Tax=Coffea arabica TaxID=13443 RepID=A0ABM4U6B0_COFAR